MRGQSSAIAQMAIGKRLAGLDGKRPEVQLPQSTHRWFDMVFFANRHPATGEDQVMGLRRHRQHLLGLV